MMTSSTLSHVREGGGKVEVGSRPTGNGGAGGRSHLTGFGEPCLGQVIANPPLFLKGRLKMH